MRKILAGLLSILGLSQAGAQVPAPVSASDPATRELRSMALDLSATEIGISAENYPHKVWGVVMETGLDDGYYTLVVLADGTTSLYFSTGGGVIGAGQHAKVKAASRQFIDLGDRMVGLAQPAASKAPPAPGSTTFFFLTFDGLRSYSAKEVELGEERDALAALFHAGHGVIASVRETEP